MLEGMALDCRAPRGFLITWDSWSGVFKETFQKSQQNLTQEEKENRNCTFWQRKVEYQ